MARQKTVWVDDAGKTHNTELQAVKADAKLWKERAKQAGWTDQAKGSQQQTPASTSPST